MLRAPERESALSGGGYARPRADDACLDSASGGTNPGSRRVHARTRTSSRLPGAAARIGTYAAPPGWRAQVPHELVPVVRPAALEQVVTEVITTPTPAGLSARALADVTRALADRIDRDNGLVIGTSLDALAAVTAWSRATVRRVIAFLVRIGRLCRVGQPLSARVLGTDGVGLTPTYVFARPRRSDRTLDPGSRLSTPPRPPVGKEDLPTTGARATASEGYNACPDEPFGKFDLPKTRRDRQAATTRLLAELGLTGRVSAAAAASALGMWWRRGWCVAALQHAVHHRPGDLPGTTRGAASNGTLPANPSGRPRQEVRDPLRVVLWRLTWWFDHEPPASIRTADRAVRLAAQARTADPGRTEQVATTEARGSRMAEIRAVLAARRTR